jgi:hypothetical protein
MTHHHHASLHLPRLMPRPPPPSPLTHPTAATHPPPPTTTLARPPPQQQPPQSQINSHVLPLLCHSVTAPGLTDTHALISCTHVIHNHAHPCPHFYTRAQSLHTAHYSDVHSANTRNSLQIPVVSVDGRVIGDGKRGPMVKRLQELYKAFFLAKTAKRADGF